MARPSLDLGDQADRIADAVRDRRLALHLGRAEFARAEPTIAYRLLQDLENRRRTRFSETVLHRLEHKLQWPRGTIAAMVAGGAAPVADDRPDYVAPDAERIDAGDGLVLWEEIAREVAPDVERAAAGMSQEDAEALAARVRETVIRQAKLFLEMEEERERQERARREAQDESS